MEGLIPSMASGQISNFKSLKSWSTLPLSDGGQTVRKSISSFEKFVKDVPCVYGQIELLKEGFLYSTRLGVLTSTSLRKDFWPETHKVMFNEIFNPLLHNDRI